MRGRLKNELAVVAASLMSIARLVFLPRCPADREKCSACRKWPLRRGGAIGHRNVRRITGRQR